MVSLDRLIDGLWGDDPPETARHTIQGYVSELRKSVGPLIEHDGVGYRIALDRQTLDSLEFEARLGEARATRPSIRTVRPRSSNWPSASRAGRHSTTFMSRRCRPKQLGWKSCASPRSKS